MAAEELKTYTGRCYCGVASYTAKGLSDIWYCHCTQCRKMTGHYVAAGGAKRTDVEIKGDLTWHLVSENASFGACAKCGCLLFWSNKQKDTISILSGGLDSAEGINMKGHVFVANKGDYYEITDGLPQYHEYPEDFHRV